MPPQALPAAFSSRPWPPSLFLGLLCGGNEGIILRQLTFAANLATINKVSVREWRNGRRAGFRHQFPVSEGSSPFSCIYKTAGPWIESGPAVLFAALVGKHKKSPQSIARPWAFFYAREGTRTPKDKPHAPQTCASASSATLAQL